MSDERGRGAEDEERPGDPVPASAEPEFGSSEWLLQQLTGGRPVEPLRVEEAAQGTEPDAVADVPGTPVPTEPAPAPASFEDLLGSPPDEPAVQEQPASEFPVAFSWNLTPGTATDPAVEADRPDDSAPTVALPVTPERAEESESASPREPEAAPPLVPPVYRSPLADPVEPPPVDASLAGVEPPVPSDAPPTVEPTGEIPVAARSWVIEPSQPPQAAEPERPRTIFDPPPAPPAEAEDDESHGLAALLGLGASDAEKPSGRSIIGDTTSVIPIDPTLLRPANPTAPAVDPTPVADEPRAPEVLPSEPQIPAAEAEVALGGIPSPATSPIDSESIAAASTPFWLQPAPAPEQPEDTTPEPEADTGTADTDGLAALFGDVVAEPAAEAAADPEPEGPVEPGDDVESAPEAESPPTEAYPSAAAFGRGLETGPQPAADLEGPQLSSLEATGPATVAFTPAEAAEAATPRRPAGTGAVLAGGAAVAAEGGGAPETTTGDAGGSGGPGGTVSALWANRNNRILLLALAGLAVVLVLVGLFALGTLIPSLFASGKAAPQPSATSAGTSASPTPTPTPTPVPTVTPKPAAAVGPGTHPWDALGGGECLQPFTSVWAEDFTVVDCAAPHTAQLLYTNLVSADPAAPYPGADALAAQIPALCTASGVVDLGAAGAYPDLQVVGSYPATEEQWKSGQRSYYCFANRSSGQHLTSSVAGPGPSA
ncbi:hypothetical protein [Leifsonia xyli]|uniref:hypothetical protein n=1 Tax=Leifsonia xyli TaxID=1575 RepID=UPI000A876CD9